MNTQLLKQVSKEEKEALKRSFELNPMIIKAIRSHLAEREEEVIVNLSSAELLTSVNYQDSITALLAELRVLRQLKETLNG